MEATDRLRKFQQMFEVRKRKWENYSSGEELFGLPVTQVGRAHRGRWSVPPAPSAWIQRGCGLNLCDLCLFLCGGH